MKKSIILAFVILLITLGWLASGQIGKVSAQDENIVTGIKSELASADENTNTFVKEENANIIKVETKILTAQKIDQSIVIQGQTTHNKKIDVKSQTVGNIVNINFNRGDKVNKGMPLIEISKENRIELLESAKELIKLYEIEYSSAKQLIDKGLSSKSKLSLASFNLVNSKSDQIDINLQYEKQLANLESQIASYNSQLKQINLDIKKTKILSPFNGIITDKNVEISDYVTPGMILLTIVNLNPIKIQGYLSEFDVNKIKLNTKALVENTNGIKKKGKITFISPSAETSTRTFEIEIEADNSDLTFKSGITTSIIIEGSELLAHKIPPSILTLQDDGTIGVKTLNDKNVVIFYPIQKVKDTIDGMWVSGLPNEVNLIISGQEYVSTGQTIELQ